MAEAVIMPRQGQSVESCIFSEWFVKKGEKVSRGDMLFAYETDKAAFEQEALSDGILLATFADEGDEIPVLEAIAVIGAVDESIDEFLPGAGTVAAVSESKDVEAPAKEEKTPEPIVEISKFDSKTKIGISPRARNLAEKESLIYDNLKGTGPDSRIIEKRYSICN